MFYTTAIGRSAQYPEGDGDEVYVCCPGKTDWSVVSDVVEQVIVRHRSIPMTSDLKWSIAMCVIQF